MLLPFLPKTSFMNLNRMNDNFLQPKIKVKGEPQWAPDTGAHTENPTPPETLGLATGPL